MQLRVWVSVNPGACNKRIAASGQIACKFITQERGIRGTEYGKVVKRAAISG